MEGFVRIVQDGERQRTLTHRSKSGVNLAIKAAEVEGTTMPPTTAAPVVKPVQKSRRIFVGRIMKSRRRNDSPVAQEGKDAEHQSEHLMTGNMPFKKLTKQRKADQRSIMESEEPEEPDNTLELEALDKPSVDIPRPGRHSETGRPSLRFSLTSSLMSKRSSLVRSPSVMSHHATAIKLTKVAPTQIDVNRPSRAVAIAETCGTVTVNNTEFQLLRPVTQPQHATGRVTPTNFSRHVPSKSRPCLVDLPEAIRDKIYHLVLVADDEINVCDHGSCASSISKQPPISRVCRKLRQESLAIFYAENRFVIEGTWSNIEVPQWLRALSPSSRSLIRHVEITTTDVATALCIMASVGFQLASSVHRASHLGPMSGVKGVKTWLTFEAISFAELSIVPVFESDDGDGRIKSLDEEPLLSAQSVESARSTSYADSTLSPVKGLEDFSLKVNIESPEIDFDFKDLRHAPSTATTYGGLHERFKADAKRAVATENRDDHPEEAGEDLDSLEAMLFRSEKQYTMQRADMHSRQRYSIGREMVERIANDDTFDCL